MSSTIDLDPFIDRIAELRYLKYDSHASMPGALTWEQYKAEDPSSADALYLGEVRSEVLRALPHLRIECDRPHFPSVVATEDDEGLA